MVQKLRGHISLAEALGTSPMLNNPQVQLTGQQHGQGFPRNRHIALLRAQLMPSLAHIAKACTRERHYLYMTVIL